MKPKCRRVPDEHLLNNRRPLLRGREILKAIMADWKDPAKTC